MSRNAAKSTHANWSSGSSPQLLEFVHTSLVDVVNHRALHLQFGAPKILQHHVRVLFHKPRATIILGKFSAARKASNFTKALSKSVLMNSKYAVW